MEQIRMMNDPFRILIEACRRLYPDLVAEIYFMPGNQLKKLEEGALGITNFPDDGGTAEIFIKAEQTLEQAVDIMAHELAHVAAGPEAEHGPEWEDAYENLYRKYHEIVDMEMDE